MNDRIMTTEEKELLLKDLGARMIHGVIVNTPNGNGYLGTINLTIFGHELGVNIKATERETFPLDECKLYLRPMSSMTEAEYKEYSKLWDLQDKFPTDADIRFKTDVFDWLNAHYFDYRGFIKKGLALEAPEEMYNIKNK